jgi:hypothetical protein
MNSSFLSGKTEESVKIDQPYLVEDLGVSFQPKKAASEPIKEEEEGDFLFEDEFGFTYSLLLRELAKFGLVFVSLLVPLLAVKGYFLNPSPPPPHS